MNNNKCYIHTLCSFYEQISNGEIFSQENMTCQKKLFCFLERTSEEIFCDKMTRAASLAQKTEKLSKPKKYNIREKCETKNTIAV